MPDNTNSSGGLHIKIINDPKTKLDLDTKYGVLKLPKAGNFTVTIDEYDKEIKTADQKHTEAGKFAQDKWKERANAGWSKEKLDENWKANETQRNTELLATTKNILNKYKDVNWIWVIAPKQLETSQLSHNHSFSKGIKEFGKSITFPKILEGGGMAYLEAFQPIEGAKGKKPYGIFVKAQGQPKIVRVEWTDFNYNPLKGKLVAFGSEILLHIYTEALYGQELEINLFDEDIFKDDELNISSKSAFQREIEIHKVHPKEIGKEGVADTLTKAEQSKTNNIVEKAHYIQKVTIEVKVEHAWMKSAGDHLKIYPTVKSLKTEKYFEDFSREFLEVCRIDGKLYDIPKEVTNKPVVVSQIETNGASFHPCHYKILDYINEKDESINLFTEEAGVEKNTNLEVGIIAGSTPKKFSIKTNEDIDTKDCIFDGKPNDHENKIFTYDKKSLPHNIKITNHQPKQINGEAFFNFDLLNLRKYFWLEKNNRNALSILNLKAETCRYQHKIKLLIVPDISWNINFFYSTPDPVWYGQSSPTYDIYGTQSTAVRDNTQIGDIRRPLDRIALSELKREENTSNKNIAGGKTKIATTANRYFENSKSNFGLSVKATFDGGKSEELSFKFAESYRNTLKIIKSVYDLADKIAGAKEARDASETLPVALAGRRSLMSLSLIPPAPSAGVEWKYVN